MPRLCPQKQSLAGEFIKMPFDIFVFMIFANLTETFPPFWKLNPELSTETSKRSINCLGSVIVARTKTGDTKTRRLHIAPWEKTLDYSILKILPRQNLQCREMEGLQATATPHSFVQSRQTLREDFLLSQPANDEHGLKVVEKGGDDSWGSFKMLGQANVPFFFVELHWQLGLAPKQRESQSPPNGSGMPTLLDQVAQRFNLGRLQETRNGWIITSILLCRLPSGNRRKPICRYIFFFVWNRDRRFPIAAFKDSRSSNVSTGEIPKEICQWHSEAW